MHHANGNPLVCVHEQTGGGGRFPVLARHRARCQPVDLEAGEALPGERARLVLGGLRGRPAPQALGQLGLAFLAETVKRITPLGVRCLLDLRLLCGCALFVTHGLGLPARSWAVAPSGGNVSSIAEQQCHEAY